MSVDNWLLRKEKENRFICDAIQHHKNKSFPRNKVCEIVYWRYSAVAKVCQISNFILWLAFDSQTTWCRIQLLNFGLLILVFSLQNLCPSEVSTGVQRAPSENLLSQRLPPKQGKVWFVFSCYILILTAFRRHSKVAVPGRKYLAFISLKPESRHK